MMIKSIRTFLIISILLSILVVSSITIIGDYFLNLKDIKAQQDSQLITTAHTFAAIATQIQPESIIHNKNSQQEVSNKLKLISNAIRDSKSKNVKLEFEVWNNKNNILLHSKLTFNKLGKTIKSGLSTTTMKGQPWRTYALYNSKSQLHVLVAQPESVIANFSHHIIVDNILIIIITYPLIGLAIWFFIRYALRSFNKLTREITNRASSHLDPVDASNFPTEIFPFADALNNLFYRLKLSIEQMKRFSSNASHELKTPLAALKTHTQVALASTDAKERKKALENIQVGVDRATHVVKQLLVLSRLEPDSTVNNVSSVNLSRLVVEITAHLTPMAIDKNIEIELNTRDSNNTIVGNDASIGILIRNLIDNAIRYTPENGFVHVDIIRDHTNNTTTFRVCDNGPGVPAEFREKVFERFFRVLGTKASGSGLGLAIVKQIADLHKAKISLSTPTTGKGLQVDVTFPNNLRTVS